jgi:hypothetical protein
MVMNNMQMPVSHHLNPEMKAVCKRTLSLGKDMDTRGLQWTLSKDYSPEQRLAFALAVYFSGGLYVLVDADRGFLCVERIAQKFARLERARKNESYRIGHAFAELHDALGFGFEETIGFTLIRDSDLTCVEGFIKGFSDSTRQSLESSVMFTIKGYRGVDQDAFLKNLRHYIDDHQTVTTAARAIFEQQSQNSPAEMMSLVS